VALGFALSRVVRGEAGQDHDVDRGYGEAAHPSRSHDGPDLGSSYEIGSRARPERAVSGSNV
jgi:hypothetical protein